jgi:hypothetical protein
MDKDFETIKVEHLVGGDESTSDYCEKDVLIIGDDIQEEVERKVNEDTIRYGHKIQGKPKQMWADMASDSDDEKLAESQSRERPISSIDCGSYVKEVVSSRNNLFCFSAVGQRALVSTERWPRVLGIPGKMRASHRLSGGYLEGDRPVPPTCVRTQFARLCIRQRQFCRPRPSVLDFGRRRSVGCGCRRHANIDAHVQSCMRDTFDSCEHAVPCTHASTIDERRTTAFPLCVGSSR